MAGSIRSKITDSGSSVDATHAARPAQRQSRLMFAKNAKAAPDHPAWEVREVMDIRQAAAYLGISSDSLYKYASETVIPAFKLGNRWRFKRSLLDSWMEQQSSLSLVQTAPKTVQSRQKKPVVRAR